MVLNSMKIQFFYSCTILFDTIFSVIRNLSGYNSSRKAPSHPPPWTIFVYTLPPPLPAIRVTYGSRRRTTTGSSWTAPLGRRSGRTAWRPVPSRRTTGAGGTAGVWTTAPPGTHPGRPGRRLRWRPRPWRLLRLRWLRRPRSRWPPWPLRRPPWSWRRTSRSSETAAVRRRARATTTTTTPPPRDVRRRPCSRPRRPAWCTPAWSRRTTPTAPVWAPPGCFASSSRRPSASATAWTSNAGGPWPLGCWPSCLWFAFACRFSYTHTWPYGDCGRNENTEPKHIHTERTRPTCKARVNSTASGDDSDF